jgi:hypothetical protein
MSARGAILGMVAFVGGCGSTEPSAPAPLSIPAPPPPAHLPDPGFHHVGGAPLALDGEVLYHLRDGVITQRDAALVENRRLLVKDVTSFAVLGDHSVVALANGRLHRVIDGKVTSQPSTASAVFAARAPSTWWSLEAGYFQRSDDGRHYPPDNTHLSTAERASDGSLVMANNTAIIRIDDKLSRFAWDEAPLAFGPGPDAMTVWADLDHRELVVLHLDGDAAIVRVRHALRGGEQIVHFSSAGAQAIAVVARTVAPGRATFSLVLFDTKREVWRVSLGEKRAGYYAVLSPTSAIVLAVPEHTLRAWDRATGAPR